MTGKEGIDLGRIWYYSLRIMTAEQGPSNEYITSIDHGKAIRRLGKEIKTPEGKEAFRKRIQEGIEAYAWVVSREKPVV